MARISIEIPSSFQFSCNIPVRITDLNYGGHVGNDTILSIIHEARMQFLQSFGYSEKNLGGVGMIMGDVAIVYKNELFYGDIVRAQVTVTGITRVTFDLVYRLATEKDGKIIDIAHAKTGMVCFDYERKKPVAIPEEVSGKWK